MTYTIADFFLRLVRPFIILWGKMHFPFTHKKINGQFYYQVRDLIQVGTVLLTSTRGEFSNLFNPSKPKHGAIYIGRDSNGVAWVTEAVGKGVVKTDLVTFLLTKDEVVLVKPKFLTEADKYRIYNISHNYIGRPYDYLFKKGAEALYCFENIVLVYNSLRPEISFKCKEVALKKRIYDSDTFLKDDDLFQVMLDSRGK